MILAALLTGIAIGAAAAIAACRAWTSGALEDERARSQRLETELLDERRARAAERVEALALAHAEADPTERLPQAKLTRDEVREIRQLRKQGLKQIEIASKFGISQGYASELLSGRYRKVT